jgi:putative protease
MSPSSPILHRPELLSPAGDWECAKAAVENGADAIYFGLERFNARMRAHNFTEADLPRLMEFLHRRGVKGYVTFNTLIFPDELADAEQHLRAIIAAGVDAAIVQDVGVCRLIRQLSPDFPIHASTQMTITSAAGVEFARELGCELVVLARECSIKEIEKLRANVPLEVFVHGALCVAYSGQCLTSEALGGRSANRGECAQACRMPYELISDGKLVPLGDRRYLLSPQDLAGLELLPELIRAGVASFKIEGRLKTPEYVANITHLYREAIDRFFSEAESTAESGSGTAVSRALESEQGETRYELEMAFSRGLYTGWLRGINNQELVHGRFGKKRGVFLGEVGSVQGKKVFLKLQSPLKAGDGVVFDAGHPDQAEQGGRVYGVSTRGEECALEFGHGDIDFSQVRTGDKLWKTSDPELDRRLRESFAGDQPRYQRDLHLEVHGRVGEPMRVLARDDSGGEVTRASFVPLVAAQKQPLNTVRLREQLGRLGGTPFRLGDLANHLQGDVILPLSELNRLRREIVRQLEELRGQPRRWKVNPPGVSPTVRSVGQLGVPFTTGPVPILKSPELIVLVRNLSQLDAALDCGTRTLYCEFEDPKKYREAVRRFREWQAKHRESGSGSAIYVAPPRISKAGEEWVLKQVRSCEADGFLARNYDHLSYFADTRVVGDFSLNVANGLSAEHFMRRYRLERVTASYDLNFAQLEALLRSAPPAWFEVALHQHMPMFHMEHCVFCAFLSKGTDYTNCGRPCDVHELKLRDRVGAEHVVKADAGCRNTVFNARAQTGAEHAQRLLALGARHFRIEFVNETPGEVAETIGKYAQLLRGEITGAQVWRELKLIRQLGVTRGPMERPETGT